MSLEALEKCFDRKYKLDVDSSKNFDEYMKAIGVGLVTRKVGNTVRPVVSLCREADGKLKLSSKSTFKDHSISFNLGEEFDETTLDGRKAKSVITLEDGNRLVQVQKNGKESVIIREFKPEEVNMTLKVDDIVCTRSYKFMEN